jgi:hypothetical protein
MKLFKGKNIQLSQHEKTLLENTYVKWGISLPFRWKHYAVLFVCYKEKEC